MKKTITTIAMATLLLSVWTVSAQEANDGQKTKFSLEIDPATFAFGGYSAHIRLQPANSEHLLAGVGIYAMDLPAAIVNFNPENKDLGWKVRINKGYGLFGEYHFSEVNKKWFVGAQTSIQEFKIEHEKETRSQSFTNWLAMGYGGYTFQPFEFPLYFKTWAGIGYTNRYKGSNKINTRTYDVAPITMFATLHIGYSF
jgi:hypothetical protein